jgi:transposase
VKLIAPQLAKPYVKRGKNDAADAEALCEAMSRPTMRFVPAKTADQQAALMLVGVRERLIRNRTQLTNAIRGFAMEFGIVAATGMCRIEPLLERIAADQSLPELARALLKCTALSIEICLRKRKQSRKSLPCYIAPMNAACGWPRYQASDRLAPRC